MRDYHQAVWDEPLLVEIGRMGRRGITMPVEEFIEDSIDDPLNLVPEKLLRKEVPLPNISQLQAVRHFTRLSQMNFGVDSGMYPLGSCTMKYNPKLAQRIATSTSVADLHPYQQDETVQGILEILGKLSEYLTDITGTSKVSLSPSAGAHGEFAGALIIKKHLMENGDNGRDEMIVPDSAHGTNPASAIMTGFKIVKVPSNDEGLVDIEALNSVTSKKTAGMMLTVPNTHGLFERKIKEICSIVRDAGGLMYYDGANLNALLGKVRPGDMGFDLVHLNLHKTFSTPHGGGGPGAGPICVKKDLEEYLPIPIIDRDNDVYRLNDDLPKSIGRIKGFIGNVGVLLRAYVYILMLGREGLESVSEQSVLGANYLRKKISSDGYSSVFKNERLMHEFVMSVSNMTLKYNVNASDISKSLLDDGVHSPTTYFPITVRECLMIEPTESEPVENLDAYADALNNIAINVSKDSESIRGAPRNTSIGRLDDVKANHPKTMTLNWRGIRRIH